MEKENICTIYAEMHLVFDNDFDVTQISDRLNIKPFECKCRKDTRISPITNKQIEGFWTIKTKEYEEWDVKIVIDELVSLVKNKLDQIKCICDEYGGEVIFDIVPSFYPDKTPALYFEREFLDIVHFLNATIQIDMYVG